MRSTVILSLIFLLFFLPVAGIAQKQYDENSPEFKKLESQFVCPECSTVGAELNDRFKAEILELMNEGYTEEEIKDYFVGVYGESVLAAPETRGFSILAWVTPFVVILIASIGVILFIRKSVKKSQSS